jgi:hypothetical protein
VPPMPTNKIYRNRSCSWFDSIFGYRNRSCSWFDSIFDTQSFFALKLFFVSRWLSITWKHGDFFCRIHHSGEVLKKVIMIAIICIVSLLFSTIQSIPVADRSSDLRFRRVKGGSCQGGEHRPFLTKNHPVPYTWKKCPFQVPQKFNRIQKMEIKKKFETRSKKYENDDSRPSRSSLHIYRIDSDQFSIQSTFQWSGRR